MIAGGKKINKHCFIRYLNTKGLMNNAVKIPNNEKVRDGHV